MTEHRGNSGRKGSFSRRPREGGDPYAMTRLDSRLRGNDETRPGQHLGGGVVLGEDGFTGDGLLDTRCSLL